MVKHINGVPTPDIKLDFFDKKENDERVTRLSESNRSKYKGRLKTLYTKVNIIDEFLTDLMSDIFTIKDDLVEMKNHSSNSGFSNFRGRDPINAFYLALTELCNSNFAHTDKIILNDELVRYHIWEALPVNQSWKSKAILPHYTSYRIRTDVPILPYFASTLPTLIFPLPTEFNNNTIPNYISSVSNVSMDKLVSTRIGNGLIYRNGSTDYNKANFFLPVRLGLYYWDGKDKDTRLLYTLGIEKEFIKNPSKLTHDQFFKVWEKTCLFVYDILWKLILNFHYFEVKYHLRHKVFNSNWTNLSDDTRIDTILNQYLSLFLNHFLDNISSNIKTVISHLNFKHVHLLFDQSCLDHRHSLIRNFHYQMTLGWNKFIEDKKIENSNPIRYLPNLKDKFLQEVDIKGMYGSNLFEIMETGKSAAPFLK